MAALFLSRLQGGVGISIAAGKFAGGRCAASARVHSIAAIDAEVTTGDSLRVPALPREARSTSICPRAIHRPTELRAARGHVAVTRPARIGRNPERVQAALPEMKAHSQGPACQRLKPASSP